MVQQEEGLSHFLFLGTLEYYILQPPLELCWGPVTWISGIEM